MLRACTRVCFLRAEIASAELRRLLPLLPSASSGIAPVAQTVASLLISTSFTDTTAHSPLSHSRDCPVTAKALPLSRVSTEPSFASRPCISCVRERVHYLASVVFCADFERRCTTAGSYGGAVGHSASDAAELLTKEVEASFGSLHALKERVEELSSGAMSAGHLWIVYGPHGTDTKAGGVNVLNLPGCKVPLAHGLWPLAVVDLSEERVCDELERRTMEARTRETGDSRVEAPAWSHAARNPSAVRQPLGNDATFPCNGAVERMNLSDLQTAVARRALNAMNWSFVEEQLASALAYYNSAARSTKQQEHRKEKEQMAAVRAMGRLKDSGAVIHAVDTVTISSAHSSGSAEGIEAEPAALSDAARSATATGAEPTADVGPGASEAALRDTTAGAGADGAASSASGAQASEKRASGKVSPHESEASEASASSEPVPVQQPDGTWEYRYASGDVTKVRKDGTKVYQTKELTTTVFANGDTLFEYPNSTSILDRADGMRITTYADGTKREERLR